MGTTDSAIEKWCNECGGTTSVSGTGQAQTHATCKEQDKQNAKNTLGALGIYVAYVYGFGFLCFIFGITSMALSCCIMCNCCKMKDVGANSAGKAGGPVTGEVVGAS